MNKILFALVLMGFYCNSMAAANTPTLTPTAVKTRTHTLTPLPTATPSPTYTPTTGPEVRVSNVYAQGFYFSRTDRAVVVADTTKTTIGDTDHNIFIKGLSITNTSDGPVTNDGDGGYVKWFRPYALKGVPGNERWLNAEGTPVVNICVVTPTTFTPVAGVNDAPGMKFLGDTFKLTAPQATATPSAAEFVLRWYQDAVVNAQATARAQAIQTAVAYYAPVHAIGTPNAVPAYYGQPYLATDTGKYFIGLYPTSTPDPSNWAIQN